MSGTGDEIIVCYAPGMVSTNGIWQGDNPLEYALPLVILQMTIVVTTTRILVFVLRPLRQPRVISEILGGVILGPSVLGQIPGFANTIFPLRSVVVLETMANVGLVYFLFLVGVEMDLSVIRKTGKESLAVAIAGMVLPFAIGACFSLILNENKPTSLSTGTYILFVGVALSVTAFPVLARILVELKLINSEIGRLAMSSALLNDTCSWILLAIAIAMAENESTSLASLWVILSSAGFVVVCIVIVRPAVTWMVRKTSDGESFSDFCICMILTGVMISGFITDAIGTHSVFGAFVFGLIIPNGALGVALMEKLEDFVSGLLLPLFFAISGLKTDLYSIQGFQTWGVLIFITFLSCAGKIAGTIMVTLFFGKSLGDGFILGLLMNAKGLVELIVLNVGRDQQVLDDASFAIMVIVAVVMTAIISPIVATMYKPTKSVLPYTRRTLQQSTQDRELQVLVCVHTPRNVPTIINLLEASNPTRTSPLCINVLHLVELTGRESAMLIVHNAHKSGRPSVSRTEAQSENIIHAFESFAHTSSFVTIHQLTTISPYNSIHEDICSVAEDKRAAIIIIPFHKQQTVDGGMEATNPAFRMINKNILVNAPCSVGILIDRGLSGSTRFATNEVAHNIGVLFFCGPDDREALAYGLRMCEHPGTTLSVVRFVPGAEAIQSTMLPTDDHQDDYQKVSTVETKKSWENWLDHEFINDFRSKHADDKSIVYTENVVNNGEETVAAIRKLDNNHDLLIVGRGNGMMLPLVAGLSDWCECPELGAIGDLLAEPDFSSTVSVLVIQQYVGIVQHESKVSRDSISQSDDELIPRRTSQSKKTSNFDKTTF